MSPSQAAQAGYHHHYSPSIGNLISDRLLLGKSRLDSRTVTLIEKMARVEAACSPRLTRIVEIPSTSTWKGLTRTVRKVARSPTCVSYERHRGQTLVVGAIQSAEPHHLYVSLVIHRLGKTRLLVRVERMTFEECEDMLATTIMDAVCGAIRLYGARLLLQLRGRHGASSAAAASWTRVKKGASHTAVATTTIKTDKTVAVANEYDDDDKEDVCKCQSGCMLHTTHS